MATFQKYDHNLKNWTMLHTAFTFATLFPAARRLKAYQTPTLLQSLRKNQKKLVGHGLEKRGKHWIQNLIFQLVTQ